MRQAAGRELRLGATATARLALREGVDPHRGLLALEGFLDRDFEVVAQIAAAAVGAGIAATAAHGPEHLLENVGEPAREAAKPAGAAHAALLERRVAKAVVCGALLLILKDVVGLVDILEFLLGGLVSRITVGVMLHRHLAKGLPQFVGAGAFGDAEGFVIILLSHGGCASVPYWIGRKASPPSLRDPRVSHGRVMLQAQS